MPRKCVFTTCQNTSHAEISEHSFFITGGLVAILIASFLPIWDIWVITSWEEVGDNATLYSAASELPSQVHEFGLSGALTRYHLGNLIWFTALFIVGGLLTAHFAHAIYRSK
jgi:hypothetical protein